MRPLVIEDLSRLFEERKVTVESITSIVAMRFEGNTSDELAERTLAKMALSGGSDEPPNLIHRTVDLTSERPPGTHYY